MNSNSKTFLVVDDSLAVRKVICSHIQAQGYQVIEAEDPAAAFKAVDAGAAFDAIVSDFDMPGMNGVQFVTEMRSKPAYATMPVLFISTKDVKSLADKAGITGTVQCLKKPYSFGDFKSAITSMLA